MTTPNEFLCYAQTKLGEMKDAYAARLRELRTETAEVEQHLAEAERAETALAAILGAGGGSGAVAPQPAIAPAPQPQEPAPAASLPSPIEHGREAAIQAARLASPSRTDRQIRVLAAAGYVRAIGATTATAGALFEVHPNELAPSMLRKIGVVEEDLVAVTRALAPRKADAPQKPAEVAKVPEEPKAAAPAHIEDPALKLLVSDLPEMAASAASGVSHDIIAEWFGWPMGKAERLADEAVAQGLATSPYPGAILPVKAVVLA